MSLNNLDAWITGENDPNAPFNQPDSEPDIPIIDLMEEGRYEEAFSKIAELRHELQKLRDTAKLIQNSYLKNRLTAIIQKI